MADMIKFYRGLVSNLPTTGDNGALYITTDEGAIYYGTGTGMKRLGDFIQVENVAALPAQAHQSCLYYCVAENILAKWTGTEWKQINKQPTAEELKTLLGLGSLAYLSEVAEDNLSTALKEKVNAAAEGNHAHLNKGELDKVADGDVEKWNTAYTHSQADHAPVDAQANIIESVKVNGEALTVTDKAVDITVPTGALADKDEITKDDLAESLATEIDNKVEKETGKSLVADTEIERLAAMSDGANKVEASETNGKIKIDGEEVTVYTHPEKHAITEVDGLETALAGKQDVIPENTYDAHGAANQALTDAKAYVDEEDKFEIDMVTVNAHGGVAAGEDLNGLTTHEILKKILYPYVQPTVGNATASPNGGTYEKGVTKTITQVSISVTKKSEVITSVALYNGSTLIEEKTGDAVKNGGTITFSGLSVEVPTNGNQLTVKVTDAKGTVQEKKTTAMTFVYPYYMGSCAAGTAVDETLVESLTKKVESKGNKSNSFTVSDGHMVFAYPKAHGVLKSILDPNNFETIGNYTRSEVSVTGLDGTAQTYYVYVSGATTVSGFVVNFKY